MQYTTQRQMPIAMWSAVGLKLHPKQTFPLNDTTQCYINFYKVFITCFEVISANFGM